MSCFKIASFGRMDCLLLIAVTCVAAIGCNSRTPQNKEQPVPKVTVAAVTEQQIVDADEYIGKTEASEIVEIRARVFGYLNTIDFNDGDMVEKDKVLFTIERDEYEAINNQSHSKIALYDARHELAQTKMARNKKLVDKGAISVEEYEESVAAVKEAAAQITAAKADADRTAVDLKYTEVKAPISGRVDRALVSKGNLLTGGMTSGTMLTKIVQEQPMYVYFDVDERSLLRYKRMRKPTAETEKTPGSLRDLGIECFLQLADEKDFTHEGQLDFASATVNPGTGTARIRGVFKNKDRLLSSGLFVRIRVPIGEGYPALLVPERALATDLNIKYVYVVGSDKKAERRRVELGPLRGEMRVINSGLKAGEQVIVKGLQRVKPDQPVDPESARPTSSEPEKNAEKS